MLLCVANLAECNIAQQFYFVYNCYNQPKLFACILNTVYTRQYTIQTSSASAEF